MVRRFVDFILGFITCILFLKVREYNNKEMCKFLVSEDADVDDIFTNFSAVEEAVSYVTAYRIRKNIQDFRIGHKLKFIGTNSEDKSKLDFEIVGENLIATFYWNSSDMEFDYVISKKVGIRTRCLGFLEKLLS